MSVQSITAPGAYALNLPGSAMFTPPSGSGIGVPAATTISAPASQTSGMPATIQAGVAPWKEGPPPLVPHYEADQSTMLVNTSSDNASSSKISPALKATLVVDLIALVIFASLPLVELLPRRMRRNIEDAPGTLASNRKNLGCQKRRAAESLEKYKRSKKNHLEKTFRKETTDAMRSLGEKIDNAMAEISTHLKPRPGVA